MRTKILLVGLVCLFLVACESPFAPEAEIPEPEKPKANIVLDGELNGGYGWGGLLGFSGYVKNIGNGTGYNCMVEIQCFSDASKTTIIDTAKGFPADLGDIAPGQRAYFEAIAFNATCMADITYTSVKITWLNRDY